MIRQNEIDFEEYLGCLRDLVKIPTVFTQPDQIETGMRWCQDVLSQNLMGYRVYRDRKKNLIACPEKIDVNQDIIYLSAHMDIVDADPLEWDEPFSPFSLYEDEYQMVARGVSDCKAGVAFELLISRLARLGEIKLSNLVFTITFKEEGAGIKTSRQIGEDLGTVLPISEKDTFFIVLENNVTVSDPSIFSFYTAERGNFVIRVSDTLDRLRTILSQLSQWNPVSIRPDIDTKSIGGKGGKGGKVLTQKGGHVCSVPREKNLLTSVIAESLDSDLLLAGDESGFAVIPSKIYISEGQAPVVHHLVLSNRSFDTIESVHSQLDGLSYRQVKDFSISEGMNYDKAFSNHHILSYLKEYKNKHLRLKQTYNVGVSDATIVTRSMDDQCKQRFYPIVLGPGTRSQRNISPIRLTHGKNETFDKNSGKLAVECLLSMLTELGAIANNID
ncbi:M20/M25/M40 family metallo-hydrolase [Desulforhopalus sp. 52FAK]